MKCPVCNKGEMKKNKDIMEQDEVEFEVLKCVDCGEELMTMKQLKVLAKKYRELRKSKEVTFARWGNSLAVRIPNEIVTEFNIIEGKHGILTKDKKGINIIPIA
ncbi:MAG: hypothetical protein Q8R00_02360 [Candidatus Nanoarchaeia archaeon]|nr:hypothetical protein [Candidatus Nanoarchaeia archaeon]